MSDGPGFSFEEQKQRFSFDTSWERVVKFDDHPLHRAAQALNGVWLEDDGVKYRGSTRGVDFVGLRSRRIYLMEAKDYRLDHTLGRRIWGTDELARRVSLKVRDSMATILGGVHRQHEEWQAFGEAMVRNRAVTKGAAVVVVLFVETGPVPDPPRARERRHGASPKADKLGLTQIQLRLKSCLAWLDPQVLVTSQSTEPREIGVTIDNLPGATP